MLCKYRNTLQNSTLLKISINTKKNPKMQPKFSVSSIGLLLPTLLHLQVRIVSNNIFGIPQYYVKLLHYMCM